MTQFRIKDLRVGETEFRLVDRPLYKRVIKLYDRQGTYFRVGTTYVGHIATKWLTVIG